MMDLIMIWGWEGTIRFQFVYTYVLHVLYTMWYICSLL